MALNAKLCLVLVCVQLAFGAPGAAFADPEADFANAFWGLDRQGLETSVRQWHEDAPTSARAVRSFAQYLWQFEQDIDAARSVLRSGLADHPGDVDLLILLGRVEVDAGSQLEAKQTYDLAFEISPRDSDLIYYRALNLFELGQKALAAESLLTLREVAPGHLKGCLLLIRLGVRSQDYRLVQEAWEMLAIVGYKQGSGERPSDFQTWRELGPRTDSVAHEKRGELLARWHHYWEAAQEYDRAGMHEAAGRMRALDKYESAVNAIAVDYYRSLANEGAPVEETLWDRLRGPVETLSGELDMGPLKSDQTLEQSVRDRLIQFDERFRWMSAIGKTNGRLDLHFGHVVASEPRDINQWGQEVKVNSVTLFNMVSNGFSEWFWDGRASDGGWIASGEGGRPENNQFINVLDPKFGAAIGRTRVMASRDKISVARREWHEALAEARQGTQIGFDNRVRQMLLLRSFEGFLSDAETLEEARTRAVQAVTDHFITTSTVIHEGQHILDTRDGFSGEQWVLEYRGKLTEIAYGELPFLPLYDFYSSAAVEGGQGTPHLQAESELMRNLALELSSRPERYPNINPKIDLWVQIPLLSDDDLRSIVRDLFGRSNQAMK